MCILNIRNQGLDNNVDDSCGDWGEEADKT